MLIKKVMSGCSKDCERIASTGQVDRFWLDKALTDSFGQFTDFDAASEILKNGLSLIVGAEDISEIESFKSSFDRSKLKSLRLIQLATNDVRLSWESKSIESVSIISALYNNDERELQEFLESLLASVRLSMSSKVEVVLCDDCSSNFRKLSLIVDDYRMAFERAGASLILLRNTENRGPGRTRNRAAKQASGEILLFVDSDDLIHPLYVQVLGQELSLGANFVSCAMQFPDTHIFSPFSSDLKQTISCNSNGSCIGLHQRSHFIRDLIAGERLYTNHVLRHFEDWELNIVLKGIGLELAIIPAALYYYRLKESGRDSSDYLLKEFSRFGAIESAMARLSIARPSVNLLDAFAPIMSELVVKIRPHRAEFSFSSSELRKILIRRIFLDLELFAFPNGAPRIWINFRRAVTTAVRKFRRRKIRS